MAERKAFIGLRDLTDGAKFADKRQELEMLRTQMKQDWVLNREFYNGNQWSWIGRDGQLQRLVADNPGASGNWKVRLQQNRIKPGVQHLIAQMTKNKPIIQAEPHSGADRDVKAAQMADALYEHLWDELSLRPKLQTALTDSQLSAGFWEIDWDGFAGKQRTITMDPNGQPIPPDQDELAQVFLEQLQAQGVDPAQFQKVVLEGEIRVTPKSGHDVLLDPAAKLFENAKYAVVTEEMDLDELYVRFPKAKQLGLQPDVDPGDTASVPAFSEMRASDEKPKTLRRIYKWYMQPQPALPQGRYVVTVESPNEILHNGGWPFPFTDLPLVKFPGIENPGSVYDMPRTSDARPLNLELNRTASQVMQHKNLTIKPQMTAPVGSLKQRITGQPGAVFEYVTINGEKPEWRQMPNLPAYVFEVTKDLRQQIDELYNRMPTQRDALPARMDSGDGVNTLLEAVSDQIAPEIERMEIALARAGDMMAALAQRFYVEERMIRVKGVGGSVHAKKFTNADIKGGYSFRTLTSTGLPRTRSGKIIEIEKLMQMGLMDPRMATKHLDLGDLNGLRQQLVVDEDHALREHDKMLRGIPLNPMAIQQAMAAVEQGINPESGQPIQGGQEEMQYILQRASVMPPPATNGAAHVDVHATLMKSVEFESYPPEVQQRFIWHYEYDQQLAAQQAPQPQTEKPRVNLALKGTTSAPVAGEILRATGLNVTDEQVAEEPLETWVTDSIDKPDMDSAGNDPLEDEERLMAMRQTEQKHALDMAKTAHEVSLAEAKARQASEPADDFSDIHSEETHQQKLRHSEESHREKLKQARKPKAKSDSGR